MPRYISTACYLGVIFTITTLKSFFRIGDLWVPANQRVRQLRLIPLDDLSRHHGLASLVDYVGNLALFIPLGLLLYACTLSVRRSVMLAAGVSACVEATQFAFALGRTDVDDLFFNSLGAYLGAAVAAWCGVRFFPVWNWLAIGLSAVFITLVAL